jgi:hypothetical protein
VDAAAGAGAEAEAGRCLLRMNLIVKLELTVPRREVQGFRRAAAAA